MHRAPCNGLSQGIRRLATEHSFLYLLHENYWQTRGESTGDYIIRFESLVLYEKTQRRNKLRNGHRTVEG
jgi:hypothetical protein